MGNTASSCTGRRKFDGKIGRQLPAELLCEIAKFIPLKVERKKNKKKWEEEKENEKVRNFIKKSLNRLPIRRKIVKGNVQPVNADLLVVNSRLTAFLRPRCRALQQMIFKLQADFAIERRDNFCNIFIKKRQISENGKITTNSPISMVEMLRQICFGRIHFCNPDCEAIQFNGIYGTMPMDFEANQFLDCFIRFTLTVPKPDAVFKFQIRLSFEQGQQMRKAFRRHLTPGKPYKMIKSDHWDSSSSCSLDWHTKMLSLYDKVYSNLYIPFQQQCWHFSLHLELKKVDHGLKVEQYYLFSLSSHYKETRLY